MANMAEYFARRDSSLPAPTFQYGERVFAKMDDGTPVVGMVIREGYPESDNKGRILLHLDLPVMNGGQPRFIVWVNCKTAKLRDRSTDDPAETL